MPKLAIYAGTFDPPTNGHLDIIRRARKLFPRLLVAIAADGKDTMFSPEERKEMLQEATKGQKVKVEVFRGLLTSYAARKGALTVVRGLRAVSDFEYEFQMALMNRSLKNSFEVVFLTPSEEYLFLSSSLVKEVSRHGGDISKFVPANVYQSIKAKIKAK